MNPGPTGLGTPASMLFGQITGPLVVRSAGPVRMIGIRFHPHVPGTPTARRTALAAQAVRGSGPHRACPREARRRGRWAPLGSGEGAGGGGRMDERLGSGRSYRLECAPIREAPKLVSRMQRFQHVFPALESADVGWAAAALLGILCNARARRLFPRHAWTLPAKLREVVMGEAMKNSGVSRGVLLVLLALGLGPASKPSQRKRCRKRLSPRNAPGRMRSRSEI
jgi:hypothetical protein